MHTHIVLPRHKLLKYIHTYMHTHSHSYMHACMHAYIQKYTHTNTYVQEASPCPYASWRPPVPALEEPVPGEGSLTHRVPVQSGYVTYTCKIQTGMHAYIHAKIHMYRKKIHKYICTGSITLPLRFLEASGACA